VAGQAADDRRVGIEFADGERRREESRVPHDGQWRRSGFAHHHRRSRGLRRRHLQLSQPDHQKLPAVGQRSDRRRRWDLQCLRHARRDELDPVGQHGQRVRWRDLRVRHVDGDQLDPVGQLGQQWRRGLCRLRHAVDGRHHGLREHRCRFRRRDLRFRYSVDRQHDVHREFRQQRWRRLCLWIRYACGHQRNPDGQRGQRFRRRDLCFLRQCDGHEFHPGRQHGRFGRCHLHVRYPQCQEFGLLAEQRRGDWRLRELYRRVEFVRCESSLCAQCLGRRGRLARRSGDVGSQ